MKQRIQPLQIIFTIFLVLLFTHAQAHSPNRILINEDLEVFKNNAINGKMGLSHFHEVINRIEKQKTARVIVQLKSLSSVSPQLASPSSALLNKGNAIKKQLDTFISRFKIHQIHSYKRFQYIPFMVMEVDETMLNRLLRSNDIISIKEDTLHRHTLNLSVPHINADLVWDQGFTGSGQTIAILDTGIDTNHSFLTDSFGNSKVISEACYSTSNESFNATALCQDGSHDPGSGTNCTDISGCDHGTHVAGIAAGNGDIFSGVAKDANLISIQVFSKLENEDFCGSTEPCIGAFKSDYIQGLERVFELASNNGLDIASVNMSLGGSLYNTAVACNNANPAVKQAIDNLRSIGIATIISSGNNSQDDSLSSPGCISSAISVGASDNENNIGSINNNASFSNSASWLSLLAPGINILSSTPGDTFGFKSGTSMATPHVSGAFALLKSKNPAATVDQLLASLVNTGVPINDPRNGISKSRISVEAASNALDFTQLPVNLILDNDFNGLQTQGSFIQIENSQSYNGTALEGSSAEIDKFRFTPALQQSGLYRLHGWWPALTSNSSQAIFDISHDSGVTPVIVDQQNNGNQWVELGIFQLSVDNPIYIEISDNNGANVIADAVRFEFLPEPPLQIDTISLPNAIVGTNYSLSLQASGGTAPYSWSLSSGSLPDGLSLNSTAGTISGIPTSATNADFDVTVEDINQNIAIQKYSLIVENQPNLNIDFNNNDISNWSIIDQGNKSGPSQWGIVSDTLMQSSNIYGGTGDSQDIAKPGTHILYDPGFSWTDIQASFTMFTQDNDAIGILFRYQDENNYYRFSWDKERSYRRLVKRVNGVFTLLAEDNVPYIQDQIYQLNVVTAGSSLKISIDGATLFSISDTSLSSGTIAFYSWASSRVFFDDLEIAFGRDSIPVINSVTAEPLVLLDTETSQITVNATDIDAGPEPLSYLWSIENGGGSLDTLTSSTTVYTPDDISNTENVTLKVIVSDGVDSVSQNIDLTIEDANILFSEDFNNSNLSSWTITDEGTIQSPSNWSTETGSLVQSSNIYGGFADVITLAKPGTHINYNSGFGWTDYQTRFTMSSTDDDAIGIIFRYQDENNYYRFSWDQQRSVRRLVKRVNGVFTLLADDNVPYTINQNYQVEVSADGSAINIHIDGNSIFSVEDASLTTGTIAFYSWANTGAHFDDLFVRTLN